MIIDNDHKRNKYHSYFVLGFIKVWEVIGSTFSGYFIYQKVWTESHVNQKVWTE